MSRIERKRLEKEAKKKRFLSFDSIKKEEKLIDESKISNGSISSKRNNADIHVVRNRKPELNTKKSVSPNSKSQVEFKEIEKMRTSRYYKIDSIKSNDKVEMKTADKIISVEDERMYFERKKKNKHLYDENVLTVDMISTAEESSNKVNEIVKIQNNKTNISKNDNQEDNIDYVKKIDIEKASFDEIKRVAELRLAAEKEVKDVVDGKNVNKGESSPIDDIVSELSPKVSEVKNDITTKSEVVGRETIEKAFDIGEEVSTKISSTKENIKEIDSKISEKIENVEADIVDGTKNLNAEAPKKVENIQSKITETKEKKGGTFKKNTWYSSINTCTNICSRLFRF